MSTPRRIAMIGRTMPAHRGGRGMFHPFLMGSALARRGHEVRVFTTAIRGHPTEYSPVPGMTIRHLDGTPPDRYSDEWWQRSTTEVEREHRREPFDVVWSDSAGAAGWACRDRLPSDPTDAPPLVTVMHAGFTMITTDDGRAFYRRCVDPMLERSAAIACVSDTVAESVREGLPSVVDRVRVIRNGIDTDRFDTPECAARRHAIRSDLRVADSDVLFMYIGRVVREKGLELLIRAMHAARDDRAIAAVIGPGDDAPRVAALAKELGVRCEVRPGVEHREVPAMLSASDVVVLPTAHQEGLPFAMIEAAAAARPVIACDVGGVREAVFDAVTGRLCPPADVRAFAHALRDMCADPDLRSRLGASARLAAVERFSLSSVCERFESLFDEVIDEARRHTRPGVHQRTA